MLKETKTDETIVFFVTFLSLVAFQLEGARAPGSPSGYAYAPWRRAGVVTSMRSKISFATTVNSKTKN